MTGAAGGDEDLGDWVIDRQRGCWVWREVEIWATGRDRKEVDGAVGGEWGRGEKA